MVTTEPVSSEHYPVAMAEYREDKDNDQISASPSFNDDTGLDSAADLPLVDNSETNESPLVAPGDEASVDRMRNRVFDVVLQSPTSSAIPLSLMTSPTSPSGSSSMTSSTDNMTSCSSGVSCNGDERSMLSDLGRRFFNRRLLSDVRLRVGERIYKAHKLILARASDVMERMLCSTEWGEASKQVYCCHHKLTANFHEISHVSLLENNDEKPIRNGTVPRDSCPLLATLALSLSSPQIKSVKTRTNRNPNIIVESLNTEILSATDVN